MPLRDQHRRLVRLIEHAQGDPPAVGAALRALDELRAWFAVLAEMGAITDVADAALNIRFEIIGAALQRFTVQPSFVDLRSST
jgi:hypothetical protein